jgi:hypothetical protein
METKINMCGTMRKMNAGDILEVRREDYRPLSVRSTAALLRENYGYGYSVSVGPEKIVITRIS